MDKRINKRIKKEDLKSSFLFELRFLNFLPEQLKFGFLIVDKIRYISFNILTKVRIAQSNKCHSIKNLTEFKIYLIIIKERIGYGRNFRREKKNY